MSSDFIKDKYIEWLDHFRKKTDNEVKAELDAFSKCYSSFEFAGEKSVERLLHLLSPKARLMAIQKYSNVGRYNKHPTPRELTAWLSHKPMFPIRHLGRIIDNPAIRHILIEYDPKHVWYLRPHASEHEIFIAIANDPKTATDFPKKHHLRTTYLKWVALSLKLSKRTEDPDPHGLRSRTLWFSKDDREDAIEQWSHYWNHILDDDKHGLGLNTP